MTITSGLNLGLPAAPLSENSELNGELQIIYNALHLLQQVLNDAGIPSGGVSPSPAIADVPHGGTGVATITGMLYGNGINNIAGITSAVVGNVLKVTGANTYAFQSPGFGDVTGPAGATANNVAVFNGATGKIIKDGGTLGSAAFQNVAAFDPAGAAAAVTPTTLGLVIGTNVQAYDADLTTWAGITPAAGIATFLATPSSANLRSVLTDETGTGAAVFADTPTLVTPVLGAATATSISFGDEVLNKYDEGTFTPTLETDGVAFTSVTYSGETGGMYIRVGKLVHFQLTLRTTAVNKTAGSGNVLIGNLPFTAANSSGGTQNGNAAVSVTVSVSWLVNNPARATVSNNEARMYLYADNINTIAVADVGTGAGANYVQIAGTYFCA